MLSTATDAQVVVPSVRTAEQVVLIVVGTHVAVFLQVVAVLAAQTKILGNVGAILVTIRGGIAPVAQYVVVGAFSVVGSRLLLYRVVHVVLHLCLAFLGALGGDHDDAIGTTRTIDGC